MNYLNEFLNHLSGNGEENYERYGDSVKKDLEKTKSDFQKDGLKLDIEGVKVEDVKSEAGDYEIHRYKGTYIYGFQKGGVFHEIPGDLSTQTERKQNEAGEIVFFINKNTRKIERITESFAGNSWGEKRIKLPSQKILTPGALASVAFIMAVIYFGGRIIDFIKGLF
ncbi:MAG: hypothetical protein OEY44_00250 [Candidatus Peregrinibacteria bacterium]|nr:hypothetical protein [Candidatus Peregrinibacteria bacterium]